MPEALLAKPTAALRWTPESFDSHQLGLSVARLHVDGEPAGLGPALSALVREWHSEGVQLVGFRVPEAFRAAHAALVRAGFREIESLVTYRRATAAALPGSERCARAQPSDRDALIEVARHAFRYDRYHADARIDSARADALKATWVANSLNGRADVSLTVQEEGVARGFCLCLRRPDRAVIDLIAVDPAAQGRGFGAALVAGALHHYAGSVATMDVSTQAANTASTALYKKLGFVEAGRTRTFHWMPAQ